jgi:cyclophilin family peptidyl-prolyl cis-trans isomerase
LFSAFKRLTTKAADNSRDARMAILDRLKDIARSDRPGVSVQPYLSADDLRPFLRDFDPNVASAVADLIGLVAGTRPETSPQRRPPQQPSALRPAVRTATIVLENDDVIPLTLLSDEAPFAVARFVQLAEGHYYDGLTFHRVVPLFVIQGGSPGANEYMGDARFMRDEIGFERHTRGAVGLSTRGRDTGDGQLFIDLTDQARLNYDYTIFARVQTPTRAAAPPGPGRRSGMDAVDAVLEGTRIRTILIGR